jgi:hypothetical protein
VVLVAPVVSAENLHMRCIQAHRAVLRVPDGARISRRLIAIVVSFFGLLAVAACGGPTATDQNQTEDGRGDVTISRGLNPLTVHDILVSIGKAGLAVPNPRDVTQRDCPEIGCTNKLETDTVSIIKFPSPGSAQSYAASTRSRFQIADVVVTFSSAVPTSEQSAYEEAVQRAIE